MSGEDLYHWLRDASLGVIERSLVSRGCDQVIVKALAPNDNTKNQIYLGPDLASVSRIPSGDVVERPATSRKPGAGAPIYGLPVRFAWLTSEGHVPAPDAKLIYYPQYPEVRLSGLLRGCSGGPNALLDPGRRGREPGRLLLLGIAGATGSVYALVVPADAPAANELRAKDLTPYGALSIWELTDDAAAGPPRESLLKELCRVHREGWLSGRKLTAAGPIPYTAPNAGGFTLEAELGITPNGIAAPDFLGWEVKQHDVGRLDQIRHHAVTLMTPEPNRGVYADEGAVEFVRRWGHTSDRSPDRHDFSGIHRVGERHPRTGLSLTIADDEIALIAADDTVAASWTFPKMLEHWKRKHAAAVFVPSEKRRLGPPDGVATTEYRYGADVLLGEGTTFQHLLGALGEGTVYYDPGIHIDRQANGSWRAKKRSQFRVNARYVGELYETSAAVGVCS